jgi:site-specific DNA recombinase
MPIDLTTSQALLKANATRRKTKRSESGALLQGKPFDDKGNLMSPSFSTKNACATYVTSALLRGRRAAAGALTRVSARAVEDVIVGALRATHPQLEIEEAELLTRLSSSRLGKDEIVIAVQQPDGTAQNGDLPPSGGLLPTFEGQRQRTSPPRPSLPDPLWRRI